jgi:hypothetical protein
MTNLLTKGLKLLRNSSKICHVLRHQPALVHEPAAASRTNPDNRQPTPSPATTAMTNLLTKGLKLLRNSSKR